MIRLICVGVGGMGRYDSDAALKVKKFKAAAGVDVNAEARRLFAEKYGCPVFEDFEKALRSVKADAALIAAPDAYHAPYSIAAMCAGMDVICEKPMAATIEDARRMCRVARESGRMLMIHHQLRWLPAFHRTRELIERGDIGTLQSVELDMSVFSNACLSGYRSRLPHLMLKDLGIHHLDLLRFLAGSEAASVFAKSWISCQEGVKIPTTTHAVAVVEMCGGITATYRGTMRALLDITGYTCRVKLNGSRGALMATGDAITMQTFKANAAGKPPRAVPIPKSTRDCWHDFADAIITRKPPLTSCFDNIRSVELMYAAIRSADTGRIVRIRN